MKYLFFTFLLSITFLGFSQSEAVKHVTMLMNQLRAEQALTADRHKILTAPNSKEIVQTLKKYTSDTVLAVRYEALNLLLQVANQSKDKVLLKTAIQEVLVNAVFKNTINQQIINLLKRQVKDDFESDALVLMKHVLESQESNIGSLARVYAFAGGTLVLNDLSNLMAKPNLTKGDKKDIRLALVRCGDERLAAKMNETLKLQVVNDDLIYSALPDILYTKDKALFSFLLNAILSDAKKCSSANNDDSTPMICAYRLMEQLAPHVVHFPVTINNKGEIQTKDMAASLTEVRTWIQTHKETFELNKTIY